MFGFVFYQRFSARFDDFGRDDYLFDFFFFFGCAVHDVEHCRFEDPPQASRPCFEKFRLSDDRVKSPVGKGKTDAVESEKLLVLRDKRVFRLDKDPAQFRGGKFFKVGGNRKSADKLGDQAETEKVDRLYL